jgi:hypothetical protein
MSVVLLGGAALLTDVAWWWTNELRMKSAADAAALAGAIYLPGNEPLAFLAARAEAAKNGYTTGIRGTVVTPRRDPDDPRKLIVDIDTPVSTFFARVFCWQGGPCFQTVDVGVTGAAVYVLPAPMGSPQNYYGVGFFQGVVPGTTTTTPGATAWLRPSGPTSGSWNDPSYAFAPDESPASVRYARRQTNPGNTDITHEYGGFGVTLPAGAAVTGIEVGMQAYASDTTGCQIRVALNSPSGTWSSNRDAGLGASPPETTTPAALGGGSDLWGRGWTASDVAGLRVRVQARDPGSSCADGSTTFLDVFEVKVHYSTSVTTPTTYPVLSVPDPAGPAGATLPTQGFWGAIFTPGGVRENGDRYAPAYIGANDPPDGTNGGPNPNYDADGHDYTIEVGSGGQVRLFDPVFCATGANLSGGWFGTGDHWTTDGTGGGTTIAPVAVRFRLFDTNGTPFTETDDIQAGSTLAYDPGTSTLGDLSGSFSRPGSPPQNSGRADAVDCSSHPAHNQWVLPSGWSGLSAGTYRLNVNTNLGRNADHGAENLFSIWVAGSGRARVYGGGRMAAYTNLDDTGVGGAQQFYFSQIEGAHAGKTMQVTLFDPGEASRDSYLRFLSPQGGTYHYATFTWSSNDGRSGSGTEIQTASTSAGALFNNRILTISIPLDLDYASDPLDPDGLGEDGWWKVEYDVRAGNDTTTWEVAILGNPVHLVME